MASELTMTQERERAIQLAISATFGDRNSQADVLIAALARIVRSRNHGRPLAQAQAANHCQLLCDALTDGGDSPGARRYVDLEVERDELRRRLRYIASSLESLLDEETGQRIATVTPGFLALSNQLKKTASEFAAGRI